MKVYQSFIFISLFLISSLAYSNVIVNQPDKILGFTGYDGRNIQLAFTFDKPIEKSQTIDFFINDKKILSIKNETSYPLQRFVTRFRFNREESLVVKSATFTSSFTPTVSNNYFLPDKHSFSIQPRVAVINEQIAKAYDATLGDCIFMYGGISNSGNQVPKTFIVKINGENIIIDSSERVATSPFFIVGLKESAKTCEINVQ